MKMWASVFPFPFFKVSSSVSLEISNIGCPFFSRITKKCIMVHVDSQEDF